MPSAIAVIHSLGASLLIVAACQPCLAQMISGDVQREPRDIFFFVQRAAATNPTVRAAQADLDAARQDVETTRLQRLPTLTATLESKDSNLATTPTRVVALEQSLWDAGRVSAQIAEANSISRMGAARVDAVRQDLALQVIGAWQTWSAAQGRISVARSTMDRLQGYRQTMQRRVDAQASPLIELDLVEARLLQTQVELNQARANASIAVTKLAQLTGVADMAAAAPVLPTPDVIDAEQRSASAADTDLLADSAPTVLMARMSAEAAKSRLDQKEAEKYPQLYLRLNKPIDSGGVNGGDTRLAAFLGIRFTPGSGFSQFSATKSLALRAASAEESIAAARREVVSAIGSDRVDFLASAERLPAAEKSVAGSERVLESYLRQFTASRKTWQDVLNAARELAQNQYSQIDIQTSMAAAMYRLWVRSGRLPGLEPALQAKNS